MIVGRFRIVNEKGLHARAATQFVKAATQFKAEISVARNGNAAKANGKSVMSLLTLAAPRGTEIEIIANGEDATEALAALGGLVERGFGEVS